MGTPLESPPIRDRFGRRARPPILLAAIAAASACEPRMTEPTEAADLILHNANVITMSADGGTARALAIKDGQILAVGSVDQVLAFEGTDTRRVDMEGRTVLPGIVDPHTHLLNDAWRLDRDLAGGQDLLLEHGITTLGNAFVTPEFLEDMRSFEASGQLVVRTSLYLVYTDNCGALQGDWWRSHAPTREFGERLRIGGIKLFMDGGTCGRPALRHEITAGSGPGDLFLTVDDVATAISAAEETGHQALIHAIGDRAVETAQDGIERALAGGPNTLRHRIDHNALAPPDLIARYRELDIQPVLFGPYVVFREMVTDPGTCGLSTDNEYYLENLSNLPAFLDGLRDVPPAWHGDDPWIGPISPFRELYLMVSRNRRSETTDFFCAAEPWQLATAVTPEEGLRMMTTSSARALLRETEVGSLERGKLADLIVVSADPLAVETEALWDIVVEVTVVAGEVAYCREACWDD